MNEALKRIKAARGMALHIATELKISPAAISKWDEVPIKRVIDVERVTGIPRTMLRPDFYPPAPEARHRKS